MNTKSRIAPPVPQAESPMRHLPLVDLLVDTKTELLELALRFGLKVFTAMLEEDRTTLCGPRYAHEPDRPASRAGTVIYVPRKNRLFGRHTAHVPAADPAPQIDSVPKTTAR